VHAGQARDHLDDARVHRTHFDVEIGEELDFRAIVEARERVDVAVERLVRGRTRDLDGAAATRS
jgi:hypothetical protein